ncbi:MAG: hypothetical protein K2N84_04015 [Clostridia bacterium]|nr:hypothetical protein [Clostridia bacterium]
MKKKLFAAACVLVPLGLLCACGGTVSVPVTAYWYKDSSTGNNMLGEHREEKLTYSVTFTPSTSATGLTLSYQTGEYTTYLSATSKDEDGNTFEDTVYRYETELSIRGAYSVDGVKADDFADSVKSVVYFKGIGSSLRPIKSVKTVHCHAPNSDYKSKDDCSTLYDYVYAVSYNADGEKATITYTQNAPTDSEGAPFAPTEKSVSIKDPTNYYDNEQLLFVLRGMSMDAVFNVKTINPLSDQVETVKTVEAPAAIREVGFALDMGAETKTHDIDAYRFTLQYNSPYPGMGQVLTYAKVTDKSNNTYRNVLLRMSVPILANLGTLNYTLVSASFAE